MTREEAYNRIDVIIAKNEIDDEYVTITNPKDYDALRIARKALEQEPCEDCISRQVVIEAFKPRGIAEDVWQECYECRVLSSLPPVTSKPKTDVLDKIRAEIKQLTITKGGDDYVRQMAELFSLKRKVLQIIDKYKAEKEEETKGGDNDV